MMAALFSILSQGGSQWQSRPNAAQKLTLEKK